MRIRLPEVASRNIPAILSLSLDEFEQLVSVLGEIQPRLLHDDIEREVVSKLPALGDANVADITHAVLNLNDGRLTIGRSPADFASDVAESADVVKEPKKKQALKERLLRLFEIPRVLEMARARNVLLEYDKSFDEARILTDVRTIHGEKDVAPVAAVVVHTLRIRFARDQERHDVFVTMDDPDIEQMIEVLKRAQLKSEAIKAQLSNLKLDIIE